MHKKLFLIFILFFIIRGITIYAYKNTYYYYGMVMNQFSIAEAAYNGHWFSHDTVLETAVLEEATNKTKYIPLENWKNFKKSGIYSTFPAQDVPGFGYIMSFTSKFFSKELTSKYAFGLQLFLEVISLLIFTYCIYLILGERIAFTSALIYLFAYPFIWPIASQPMRDLFVLGIYSFYISAFFLFSRRKGFLSYFIVFLLIVLSSSLLWIRPIAYYFFFLISPLVLFVKNKSFVSRLAFFLGTILIPFFMFGYQLQKFNIKYYGIANTDVLGRGLWEGMGIIENNPYGFALDDQKLVPWAKSQGYDVEYSSPQMNKLLGDYARKVVRENPTFYFKTVLKRCLTILKGPLNTSPPYLLANFRESKLTVTEYIIKHFEESSRNLILKIITSSFTGTMFFYLGLISTLMMLYYSKGIRLELTILLFPFFYALGQQIPLHFETRTLATGAWVLVLPLGWATNKLLTLRKN